MCLKKQGLFWQRSENDCRGKKTLTTYLHGHSTVDFNRHGLTFRQTGGGCFVEDVAVGTGEDVDAKLVVPFAHVV